MLKNFIPLPGSFHAKKRGTNLPLFDKVDDSMIAYILLGISLIFIILCNRHVRKFRAFFSPFYYACKFKLIIKLYKIRYRLLLLCLALVIIQQFQYVPVSFSNKQHTTSPFTEYGFIFPKSDSTYLTDSDITVLHNKITEHSSYNFETLLSFARNEIYARHGHNFKNPVFSDYYSQYEWYISQPLHFVD